MQDSELTSSLIIRRKVNKGKSSMGKLHGAGSPTKARDTGADRSTGLDRVVEDYGFLQWERSDQGMEESERVAEPLRPPAMIERLSSRFRIKWNVQTEESRPSTPTLNQRVFRINNKLQNRLYWFNFLVNLILRISLLSLLLFLAFNDNMRYLVIFLSLEGVSIALYVITMIKMLFTRSDVESIYFQKIFNDREWVDIQEQRLMRRHFSATLIICKCLTLLNPRTRFHHNDKIAFLKQDLYKRIELTMVHIPFAVTFLLNKGDFLPPNDFELETWIDVWLCVETLRTALTYLLIYVYS